MVEEVMMGGSAFKSMYCSFKVPKFNSSILDGQLSLSCNSKPGNVMSSFGIYRHCTHVLVPNSDT